MQVRCFAKLPAVFAVVDNAGAQFAGDFRDQPPTVVVQCEQLLLDVQAAGQQLRNERADAVGRYRNAEQDGQRRCDVKLLVNGTEKCIQVDYTNSNKGVCIIRVEIKGHVLCHQFIGDWTNLPIRNNNKY